MQSYFKGSTKNFFIAITILADIRIYIVVLILIFCLDSRDSSIYFMINFSFYSLFLNILRIAYRKPRPYMEDPEIIPYLWSGEFGTPSGHAFFSAYLPTILALYYVNSSKRLNTIRNKIVANWIYVGLFIFTIIISFTRVVNGVHTIDQVLFGLQIGWFWAFYIHWNLKNMMLNHINQFLLGEEFAKKEAWKHFILLLIVFVFFLSLFLIPYFIIKATYTPPGEWETTMRGHDHWKLK